MAMKIVIRLIASKALGIRLTWPEHLRTSLSVAWQRLLQELDTIVPGFRLLARSQQLDIILYGVESHQLALAVRDAVQTFVVKTKT